MKFHSIFVSDFHMRTSWCKSKRLYEFLQDNTCDNLFLNGDIIDTYNINRAYVDAYQCKCIQLIKDHPNSHYILGNHDLHYFPIATSIMEGIRTYSHVDYTSLSGERLLIAHGHEYDPTMGMLGLFKDISLFRRLYSLVSLRERSKLIRLVTKFADHLLFHDLTDFKKIAMNNALNMGFWGVITGHTHMADMDSANGIIYMNSGCWTSDKCTALVEDMDGRFYLLHG